MTVVLLVLWLVTLVALLRVLRPQRMLAQAGSLKRVLDMRPVNRAAVSTDETDRFIRDQDHELFPTAEHQHINCAVCGPGPLRRGMVPSGYPHPFFKDERIRLSDGYGREWWENTLTPSLAQYADVVSSTVIKDGKVTGLHTIMLDMDYPVTVIESTTAEHHHLYADKLVTWRQLRRLLRALRDCDLIEEGFYTASISRRATHLRPPWTIKHKDGGQVEPENKPSKASRRWDA